MIYGLAVDVDYLGPEVHGLVEVASWANDQVGDTLHVRQDIHCYNE